MSFSFGFLEISFSIAVTALIVGAYLLGYTHGHNARDIELWKGFREINPTPDEPSTAEKTEA